MDLLFRTWPFANVSSIVAPTFLCRTRKRCVVVDNSVDDHRRYLKVGRQAKFRNFDLDGLTDILIVSLLLVGQVFTNVGLALRLDRGFGFSDLRIKLYSRHCTVECPSGSWMVDIRRGRCVIGVQHNGGCLERRLFRRRKKCSGTAVLVTMAGFWRVDRRGDNWCILGQETSVRPGFVGSSRTQGEPKSKRDEIPWVRRPKFSDLGASIDLDRQLNC